MHKKIYGVTLCFVMVFSCNATNNKQSSGDFVGRHPLTLHWINTDLRKAGVVEIKRDNNSLQLYGSQVGQGEAKGDYISIQGVITDYSNGTFSLTGKIITHLRFDNGGLPCVMTGKFTFKKSHGKKYWRLQESKSLCSTTTNYIDIY